jgi:hypothetical protein
VYRCWVSEYQALPDLDANANAIAIQHLKLENEGWERDYDVVEPAEPKFTDQARRLMAEVAVLARAYHWSEGDILALPPGRRRFYLEAVG